MLVDIYFFRRTMKRKSKKLFVPKFDTLARHLEIDGLWSTVVKLPAKQPVHLVYTLFNSHSLKRTLSAELPGFLFALLVTELLFKLGSLGFELLSFLLVWRLVSFLQEQLRRFAIQQRE